MPTLSTAAGGDWGNLDHPDTGVLLCSAMLPVVGLVPRGTTSGTFLAIPALPVVLQASDELEPEKSEEQEEPGEDSGGDSALFASCCFSYCRRILFFSR